MDFSFGDLFDQFNTPESYTILVIILIAFLFGFITGMLLRGARVRRLHREIDEIKPQLEAREREAAELQDQLADANSELSEKDKIFELQRRELEEAEERVLRLEQEKNKLYNELQDINAELEQLQTSNRSYLATIEELNDQLLGMQARREQPQPQPQKQPPAPETERQLKDRIERIEAKMTQLENENNALHREVDKLRKRSTDAGPKLSTADAAVFSTPQTKTPSGNQQPAETSPPADYDNLQIVEGIDARIEAHLKASGIHNWEDLADSPATHLRALLQSSPSLPQNDPQTWPIQARLALNGDWDLLEEYQQQLLGGYDLGSGEEIS